MSTQDIISSDDFFGEVQKTQVSVVEINKQNCEIEQSKIQNIQSFHSVQFEEDGMRFWQYFDV